MLKEREARFYISFILLKSHPLGEVQLKVHINFNIMVTSSIITTSPFAYHWCQEHGMREKNVSRWVFF